MLTIAGGVLIAAVVFYGLPLIFIGIFSKATKSKGPKEPAVGKPLNSSNYWPT